MVHHPLVVLAVDSIGAVVMLLLRGAVVDQAQIELKLVAKHHGFDPFLGAGSSFFDSIVSIPA